VIYLSSYKFILGILSILALGVLFISPAFALTNNAKSTSIKYNASLTKNIGQSVSKVPVMSTSTSEYLRKTIEKTPKVKEVAKQDSKSNLTKKVMHDEGLDLPIYHIDSCQDINKPGYYLLTKDILFNALQNVNGQGCLRITTGNVYLNGNNHRINYLAKQPGYYAAISVEWDYKVHNIYNTYKNINIKNITISPNFMYGVYANDWTIISDLENINLTNVTTKKVYLYLKNMKDSTFKDNKIMNFELKSETSTKNTLFINNDINSITAYIGNHAAFNYSNLTNVSDISFKNNNIKYLIISTSRLNLDMTENKINYFELYRRYYNEYISYDTTEYSLLESINIQGNDFNDLYLFYDFYGGISKGIIAGNNIYGTAKFGLIGEDISITNNFGNNIEYYIQRHCGLLSKDVNIYNNTFGSFTLLPGGTRIYVGGYITLDPFIFQLPFVNVNIYSNKINQFNISEKQIPEHGGSYYNLGHDFDGKKIYIYNNTFENVFSKYLTSFSEYYLVFKNNSCYSFEFTPEYSDKIHHESNYCMKYPN
jgi:hypothetical protein